MARKMMQISTTIEARNSSLRVGHETLFISASTAIKKSAKPGKLTARYDTHKPTRPNNAGQPKGKTKKLLADTAV